MLSYKYVRLQQCEFSGSPESSDETGSAKKRRRLSGGREVVTLYLENLKNNYLSGHCVSPAANGHPKAER